MRSCDGTAAGAGEDTCGSHLRIGVCSRCCDSSFLERGKAGGLPSAMDLLGDCSLCCDRSRLERGKAGGLPSAMDLLGNHNAMWIEVAKDKTLDSGGCVVGPSCEGLTLGLVLLDAASAERVVTVPLLKLCGGATEVVAGEHTVVSHWWRL